MNKLRINIEEEARVATDCIAIVFNDGKIMKLFQVLALVKCIDSTFNFHENSKYDLWRTLTDSLLTALWWKNRRINKVMNKSNRTLNIVICVGINNNG